MTHVHRDPDHRWVGRNFRVKADGRVGCCVDVKLGARVEGGGTTSRKQPKHNHRPTARQLELRFEDGTCALFDKYALEAT